VNPFRALSCLFVPVLLACAALAAPQERAKVLRFSGIPNNNTTELAEKYRPLARHLAGELGVEVEYVPTSDYGATVEAFKNGDLLLAWFGGLTGVRARAAVPGAHAIVCGKVDKQFKTYFVANAASGLERSDEFPAALAGRKFTFGAAESTSGRLMPEYWIRKKTGKSPRDFFGAEMHFSGGHDKTAALVQAGTFEAGALDFTTYERLVKERKLDPVLCKVIWVTPEYPDYNFTAHPALEERFGSGFTAKLTRALLAIEDPALLAGMDRPQGLVACSDADFEELRKLAVELKLVR
jgi:phosphonate transport system substrate-binding protein